MRKHTDAENEIIHDYLRQLGYQYVATCGSAKKAEYKWKTPAGEIRLMKYQRRGGEPDQHGRYLVGISYVRFKDVKDYVFWAEGEKYLLIIPTERLQTIFLANRYSVETDRTRWLVHITFDRGGTQQLKPVHCGSEEVSEFSHPIVPE
jgi:hypothetical protein